jgi:large subunit ribosomal protein L17
MRHRVAHRKLGRVTEHRIAMLRNQATALLRYEHLTTTVPRAKELRPFVERIITISKRGVAGGDANGHALNARRLVMHDLQDREVVSKLFDTIAPRFAERPGGYTRLLRLGFRRGDSAEVAQVELIGSEFDPKAKADKEAAGEEGEKPKAKGGVGGRLRAAAERLRGGKKAAGAETESAHATEAKAAKRAAKKGTTGKKMGGSSKGK